MDASYLATLPKPCVIVDRAKLRHNLDTLCDACRLHGVSVAAVTKVTCADPEVVKIIQDSEAGMIADSRLENLEAIGRMPGPHKPRLCLRISGPSRAREVVQSCEISQESELATLQALEKAASELGKIHQVILMVDMGDLREGIFFRERERLLETARFVVKSPCLRLLGLGVNLTCYGAIIPDRDNLGGLVELTEWLRQELDAPIPLISGGNSSSYTLVRDGLCPEGINHLRLGESFVLGNDTAACEPLSELYGDAFTLIGEIVEMQTKPSRPIGRSGANAFGESVTYEDRGPMRRGIIALGRQDINAESLEPADRRLEILGASSDHLLINFNEAPQYNVGDSLEFALDYGNLLKVFTSPYVKKFYVN